MNAIAGYIFISIFEAFLYSLTMYGVTPRIKRYKSVHYLGFFVVLICLHLIFDLNIFWQCMVFYAVLITTYKYIFDTDLYRASYGGLVVYILLSTNQMFIAFLAFLQQNLALDYRDVFLSMPAYLYPVAFIFTIISIILFNYCIAYPHRKNFRKSWFDEGPQHINLLLSITFLSVMSWNLKFFYINQQNIGVLPSMSRMIFFLLLLVFGAFIGIIIIVNRSFIHTVKPMEDTKKNTENKNGVINNEHIDKGDIDKEKKFGKFMFDADNTNKMNKYSYFQNRYKDKYRNGDGDR